MQMILLKKYYNITFFGNCELWTIRPWCRVAALNWPLSFFVDFSWIFPVIRDVNEMDIFSDLACLLI